MPKITVQPSAFSGEEVIQQAIDAAASQMPAGTEPPAAVPVRDASGKVTSVEVSLPDDISAADLANAHAKINENPGVSKAAPFPRLCEEDFEGAGSAGTTINSMCDGTIAIRSNSKTTRKVSQVGDALNGTK